ncbi:hypothetical protein GOODEAATRI_024231, partial [Goodea atripinnis]
GNVSREAKINTLSTPPCLLHLVFSPQYPAQVCVAEAGCCAERQTFLRTVLQPHLQRHFCASTPEHRRVQPQRCSCCPLILRWTDLPPEAMPCPAVHFGSRSRVLAGNRAVLKRRDSSFCNPAAAVRTVGVELRSMISTEKKTGSSSSSAHPALALHCDVSRQRSC